MSPEIDEVLESLAQTPTMIAASIDGLSDDEVRYKKSAREFSVLENICHLRDLESEGYAIRINRMLKEDEPLLEDFDGTAVAAQRDYNNQNLDSALQAFTRARIENVELLRALQSDQFSRSGTLPGVGVVTLSKLLGLMREHDRGHLNDLIETVFPG